MLRVYKFCVFVVYCLNFDLSVEGFVNLLIHLNDLRAVQLRVSVCDLQSIIQWPWPYSVHDYKLGSLVICVTIHLGEA